MLETEHSFVLWCLCWTVTMMEKQIYMNAHMHFSSGWHSSVRLIKLHPHYNQGFQTAPGHTGTRLPENCGQRLTNAYCFLFQTMQQSLLCNGGSYEGSHRTPALRIRSDLKSTQEHIFKQTNKKKLCIIICEFFLKTCFIIN